LLPVDEVLNRLDAQRIAQTAGATVGRGPQTDNLGSKIDQPVVMIEGNVVQRDLNRH
jgi:hypothetical protein